MHHHNFYDVMKKNLEEFDTSDYGENNRFGMPLVNKKIPGKMKGDYNNNNNYDSQSVIMIKFVDECLGHPMTHFIGLRSKMYCTKIEDQGLIKKAKGVKTNVVKNKINYDDYYKCLFEKEIAVRDQHVIRARLHNIHTETEKKIALSSNDDKRYLIPGSTDTLPWGHYAIPTEEVEEPPLKKRKPN